MEGIYEWKSTESDTLQIIIVVKPNHKIDVDTFFNNHSSNPSVRLRVLLRSGYVEIADIIGNGIGTEFQYQGFGTLAMNCVIQVLKRLYPSGGDVEGVLTHLIEQNLPDEKRIKLEEARKYFLSRFGIKIIETSNRNVYDIITGNIKDLKCIIGGKIRTQFPKHIKIEEFKRLDVSHQFK